MLVQLLAVLVALADINHDDDDGIIKNNISSGSADRYLNNHYTTNSVRLDYKQRVMFSDFAVHTMSLAGHLQ